MVLKNVSAITPGKAILFGEHFVVYGYSSIIFAIDKKFKVTISFDELNKKEFYNNEMCYEYIIVHKFYTSHNFQNLLNISKNLSDIIYEYADIDSDISNMKQIINQN